SPKRSENSLRSAFSESFGFRSSAASHTQPTDLPERQLLQAAPDAARASQTLLEQLSQNNFPRCVLPARGTLEMDSQCGQSSHCNAQRYPLFVALLQESRGIPGASHLRT